MTILKGNLITMALNGEFDVIVHGCNCFNRMRRGIGVDMAREFKADIVDNEHHKSKDEDYEEWHKSELLGNIEWYNPNEDFDLVNVPRDLTVVNAYTQYHWDSNGSPLDYEALILCMRKINHQFLGKHIGLPKIGCGLAGGDWNRVREILERELVNCNVTVVEFEKQ